MSYGKYLRDLESAMLGLKVEGLPREPYPAAKYLVLFAEETLRKSNLDPEYRKDLENMVQAIQRVTVYL